MGGKQVMPDLEGFSHIDLTVSDCEAAATWWQDVMGFVLINRSRGETFEVWSLIHPSGLAVSVMTHDEPLSGTFDERRIGLDHLGFKVADRNELQRWVTHLAAKGVSHSGIIDIGFGPTVVLRDPDNIQLDLFVHPSTDEMSGLLTDADSAEAQRLIAAEQERTRSEAETR
jgi:catechol-2,3-dioxygenase